MITVKARDTCIRASVYDGLGACADTFDSRTWRWLFLLYRAHIDPKLAVPILNLPWIAGTYPPL